MMIKETRNIDTFKKSGLLPAKIQNTLRGLRYRFVNFTGIRPLTYQKKFYSLEKVKLLIMSREEK